MKCKGLVDPKNKPFGNLLPFEVHVIIVFWTQFFTTNDRRTKMNEELTRLPCCLRKSIPMSVAFSFLSGYKRFSSAMENKPYSRFYGCPHCFRRNTQQVSVSVFVSSTNWTLVKALYSLNTASCTCSKNVTLNIQCTCPCTCTLKNCLLLQKNNNKKWRLALPCALRSHDYHVTGSANQNADMQIKTKQNKTQKKREKIKQIE